MSLFVIEHHHDAARCPARDPQGAQMLLRHLARAGEFGVTIRAEAVVDGAHALYAIADAPGEANVRRFMQPFAQAGTVEIRAASSCETVVARGGCDAG